MSDYWKVREKIMKAIAANNEIDLKQLAIAYPGIFQNVLNQAKNATRRREVKKS